MIDKAVFQQLAEAPELAALLTSYAGKPAVFNQEAPPDSDPLWNTGGQYARVVFALSALGDPARAMGGNLMIDVQCATGQQQPEDIEPIVRRLIDGYFFSGDGVTMAAQWEDSQYFTEPEVQVCGVTLTFALLAFPMLTTRETDVTTLFNEWTAARFPELFVINHDKLPGTWKPQDGKYAVYWRVVTVKPAGWIPGTWQTVWLTAEVRCHIFAPNVVDAAGAAQEITLQLYGERRIPGPGGECIMVDRDNRVETGADALRTGQLTVEAAFGEIVRRRETEPLRNIHYV